MPWAERPQAGHRGERRRGLGPPQRAVAEGRAPLVHAPRETVAMQDIQLRIAELTARLAEWQVDGETYERILDALPSGILAVSSDGTIRIANQEILRMFGYQ